MAVTTYAQWLADHSPAVTAHPISQLALTLHRHGYNVGRLDTIGLGDKRHLQAATPEDHTPYSHTPWPNSQPYPEILAFDVMEPVPASMPSLVALGEKLLADRQAGRPEVAWIKYINRPLTNGKAVHEAWKPGHTSGPTTDTGHLHLSARTDHKHSDAAAAYDPVAELLGGDMAEIAQADWDALKWRIDALVHGRDTVAGGPTKGEPVEAVRTAKALTAEMTVLKLAMAAISQTGTNAGDAAILGQVQHLAADLADIRVEVGKRDAKIARLQTTIDALRAALAQAAADALIAETEGAAA